MVLVAAVVVVVVGERKSLAGVWAPRCALGEGEGGWGRRKVYRETDRRCVAGCS